MHSVAAVAPPDELTNRETISTVSERLEPSLFFVRANGGTGSAFLFGSPDVLITNRHVVEGVALKGLLVVRPIVRGKNGFTDLGEEMSATLVLKHADYDLAILKLEQSMDAVPITPAQPREGRYLQRGLKVLAHGFPSTLSPTVSDGILSGHYRDPRSGSIFYLTDAALASGSSGGPVTNYNGELIGMTTGLYRFDAGEAGFNWGFILPTPVVEEVVAQYLRGDAGPLDMNSMIQEIEAGRTTADQIAGLRRAFERVVNSSGTHLELLENLSYLINQTHPLIRITSAEDFQEGLRAVLHMAEVSMRRSFDLARRDVPGSDERVFAELRKFMKVLTQWHLQVSDNVGLKSPGDVEDLLSTVLNIYAESFREYAYRARLACVEFSGYESSDPLTKRTYEYWSAFTETEMMRRLIVMSGGMSEQVVQAANQIRSEPQFYRLRGALFELKQAQAEVGRVFQRECSFVLKAQNRSSGQVN